MIESITANLMVESVEDTITFYQEVLGFTVGATVPNDSGTLNFAIITHNNLRLMFQQKDNFIEEYPILSTPIVKPSISLFMVVDNFMEFYNLVKDKAQILADIHKTFYGATEFAVADNNGYVITIAEKQGLESHDTKKIQVKNNLDFRVIRLILTRSPLRAGRSTSNPLRMHLLNSV